MRGLNEYHRHIIIEEEKKKKKKNFYFYHIYWLAGWISAFSTSQRSSGQLTTSPRDQLQLQMWASASVQATGWRMNLKYNVLMVNSDGKVFSEGHFNVVIILFCVKTLSDQYYCSKQSICTLVYLNRPVWCTSRVLWHVHLTMTFTYRKCKSKILKSKILKV